MITIDNEHFPGLTPDPAQVTPAISQDNGCVNFMGPKGKVYEDILALGIKLLNIAPAIRAKLADGPPRNQSKWVLSGGRADPEFTAPQIYQHLSFQILDLALWFNLQKRGVMNE